MHILIFIYFLSRHFPTFLNFSISLFMREKKESYSEVAKSASTKNLLDPNKSSLSNNI